MRVLTNFSVSLWSKIRNAQVAELVDAPVSGSGGVTAVSVRVRSWALKFLSFLLAGRIFFALKRCLGKK